jgi:hypothetical protein
MNDAFRTIGPEELPDVVSSYLRAHRDHDTGRALAAFTTDAVVQDDGGTYTGVAAIEGWLDHSATEYTYTVELVGAQQGDDARYVATQHLSGNFPGGEVDLHYRFTLKDGLIEALTIAP